MHAPSWLLAVPEEPPGTLREGVGGSGRAPRARIARCLRPPPCPPPAGSLPAAGAREPEMPARSILGTGPPSLQRARGLLWTGGTSPTLRPSPPRRRGLDGSYGRGGFGRLRSSVPRKAQAALPCRSLAGASSGCQLLGRPLGSSLRSSSPGRRAPASVGMAGVLEWRGWQRHPGRVAVTSFVLRGWVKVQGSLQGFAS